MSLINRGQSETLRFDGSTQMVVRTVAKPGITGLAQIGDWRSKPNTPDMLQARVQQDLAYIRNWSLGLDLGILAKTVLAVASAKNRH